MSFAFRQDESIDKALHRIACKQVENVLAELAGPRRLSRDKAIHSARRRIKRLRALLRLFRDSLRRKNLDRENKSLRDAAQTISASRDATVLIVAIDTLMEHYGNNVSAESFRRVRNYLLAERRRVMAAAGRGAFTPLLEEFREIKKRVKRWRLDHKGWDAIGKGLRRTYHDARKAMKDVIKKCKVESLHDWRKRVKDLRHQVELLIPAWPEELTKLEEELHHLSDFLGDDHDLAVLHQSIPESLAVEREVLLGLVTARRTHLQQQAIPLGERLFAEKPSAFTKRMHEYWHAWRNE